MQNNNHPLLIVTCGLTGSGKSTLAAALAQRLGGALLRSDVLRKELAGIPEGRHEHAGFSEGIYSEGYFKKTYGLLFERGRSTLEKGGSVILDASFKKKNFRDGARKLARDTGAVFLLIECICPEEEARRRLDRRSAEKNDVSDGRWDIYSAQKADFEAVEEMPEDEHLILSTDEDLEGNVSEVLKKIEAISKKN